MLDFIRPLAQHVSDRIGKTRAWVKSKPAKKRRVGPLKAQRQGVVRVKVDLAGGDPRVLPQPDKVRVDQCCVITGTAPASAWQIFSNPVLMKGMNTPIASGQ